MNEHHGSYQAGRMAGPIVDAIAAIGDVLNSPVSPGPDLTLGLAALRNTDNAASFVYRGVHGKHPGLDDAMQGRVAPGNPSGTLTPEQHNLGGDLSDSPFTSWTHDPSVARSFADSQGPGGVVLRTETGAPPPGANWSWEQSPDVFHEQEVLLRGSRENLEVFERR